MLSIIIVTRNTRDLLMNLLASIQRDASLLPLLSEIVIVDNASSDGTAEAIRERHQDVVYVRNDENRGFAAAVNQGWKRSTGRFLLFLNSDTLVIEGEVQKLVNFMHAFPDAGIAGPQLVHEDMSLQRSRASTPSLCSELLPVKGYAQQAAEQPSDVESLVGAALVVRREVMIALHGFDERFFFFLEETDLCVRAREKGYRVVFNPGARIIHLQGRTVRKTWVRGRIEYSISLYKFIRKHHSRTYFMLFVFVRVLKAFLFVVPATVVPLLLLTASMRRKYAYYLRLLAWHLRGCPDDAGLRSSSPV